MTRVATSASSEPVVVEPVVNREKLREVLALEAEYATLDFKETLDLSHKADAVQLAKDVGAMSVRGGFIVIGVDGRGEPSGALTPKLAELFDEARLRSKLLKWLPDSLEVHSQTHEINGKHVVLMHVSPNPSGCAFFRAGGEYTDAKGKLVTVFREGEAFFRDGTQSRRLNQRGLEEVVTRRVDLERERWEAQHAAEYRRLAEELRAGSAGQDVARGSAAQFTLSLEPDVLVAAAVELLRAKDDIPLRRLLTRAVPHARELVGADDLEELERLLDRLACLGAMFIELEQGDWFARLVKTFVAIYGLPYETQPLMPDEPPPAVAAVWLAVILRVFGLGSLAVRLSDWQSVRTLAVQREPHAHPIYPSWIRHALTMAARANLLETYQDTSVIKLSLLSLARDVVRRLGCLRPDVAADDERVLNGLAQFDFLSALVPISSAAAAQEKHFYTNFARFRTERTEPIAERLLTDRAMRTALTSLDDAELAVALKEISEMARSEGFRYDGWHGYQSPALDEFVLSNLPRAAP
jgi:Putative DNA-binding domain